MSIVMGPDRKQLECACKNKVFTLVVTPNIQHGSAEVIEVYCVMCQKGVPLDKGVLGMSKPDPTASTDVYTEKRTGRQHHMMKCDPIHIGADLKPMINSNGNNN